MDNILFIVLAFILIGVITLTTFQVDNNVRNHTIDMRENLQLQGNFATITNVVEHDMTKIGHGLLTPLNAIKVADSSRIVFDYDPTANTVYDTQRVEYVLEKITQSGVVKKQLVKKINSVTRLTIALGIDRFKLLFYNQSGTLLPTPVVADSLKKIKAIEILMIAKPFSDMKMSNQTLLYQSRIVPKNLLIVYGH